MTPTGTRSQPVLRPGRSAVIGILLIVVGTGALAGQIGTVLEYPWHVTRLTVTNPTVYQLNVEVRGGSGRGWLDLGTVGRERTKALEKIADQGPRWVFRFSYAGVAAGRLQVARSELTGADWKLTIPQEASEVLLRRAGVPPSAL